MTVRPEKEGERSSFKPLWEIASFPKTLLVLKRSHECPVLARRRVVCYEQQYRK
jgi:hypothetical protein